MFIVFQLLASCLENISLLPPNLVRDSELMYAFQNRRSTRNYTNENLTQQEISDLLWSATGVNREPSSRTNPTAYGAQDIDVYLANADGIYLYDPFNQTLIPQYEGDLRDKIVEGQFDTVGLAPVFLLIVSNITRYPNYVDHETRIACTANGAGIVSTNINLYCASADLGTVTRATMNKEVLSDALGFNSSDIIIQLNHPVGRFIK